MTWPNAVSMRRVRPHATAASWLSMPCVTSEPCVVYIVQSPVFGSTAQLYEGASHGGTLLKKTAQLHATPWSADLEHPNAAGFHAAICVLPGNRARNGFSRIPMKMLISTASSCTAWLNSSRAAHGISWIAHMMGWITAASSCMKSAITGAMMASTSLYSSSKKFSTRSNVWEIKTEYCSMTSHPEYWFPAASPARRRCALWAAAASAPTRRRRPKSLNEPTSFTCARTSVPAFPVSAPVPLSASASTVIWMNCTPVLTMRLNGMQNAENPASPSVLMSPNPAFQLVTASALAPSTASKAEYGYAWIGIVTYRRNRRTNRMGSAPMTRPNALNVPWTNKARNSSGIEKASHAAYSTRPRRLVRPGILDGLSLSTAACRRAAKPRYPGQHQKPRSRAPAVTASAPAPSRVPVRPQHPATWYSSATMLMKPTTAHRTQPAAPVAGSISITANRFVMYGSGNTGVMPPMYGMRWITVAVRDAMADVVGLGPVTYRATKYWMMLPILADGRGGADPPERRCCAAPGGTATSSGARKVCYARARFAAGGPSRKACTSWSAAAGTAGSAAAGRRRRPPNSNGPNGASGGPFSSARTAAPITTGGGSSSDRTRRHSAPAGAGSSGLHQYVTVSGRCLAPGGRSAARAQSGSRRATARSHAVAPPSTRSAFLPLS